MDHKPFGLVLGGGGARGLSHAGILRALNHLGYYPSVIAGVSMGAVVGASYSLNNQWYRDLVDMDTSGFPAVPDFQTTGLGKRLRNLALAGRVARDTYFGWGAGERTTCWGRGVLKRLTNGRNLQDGRIPLYISATDILTGKRVVKTKGDAVDAVYASSALAGVLPPLRDGNLLLVDGAYVDIAPIDLARNTGAECVIAVDPSQQETSSEPENGIQAMLRSVEICQLEHANIRFREADLVIRPQFSRTVGTLEFETKRDCIAAGARAVRNLDGELQQLLAL